MQGLPCCDNDSYFDSMNAASRADLPFNPSVLRWAREYAQLSIHEAAKKAGVSPESVEAWEEGDGTPTARQGRLLAKAYNRSFMEFFRETPPPVREVDIAPDYRLHRHVPRPDESRELKRLHRWAAETRNSALDLYELLGDAPPKFPQKLYSTVAQDADGAAQRARAAADFPLDAQISVKHAEIGNIHKALRRAIEGLGVLVLRSPELAKLGARGLCIFEDPLPVVIFSTEAPTAQSFTLAHELAHICLQQSAISGPPARDEQRPSEEEVERWCNRFAAAFLIPAEIVAGDWSKPNQPLAAIGDDTLRQWARRFGVSRHAMLVRFVDLGYVDPSFYWAVKRAEFLQEEEDYKGSGRLKFYGSRFQSQIGDMYTALVLEAWDRGLITNHNDAEFMGISNLKHLSDIRDNFAAA